MLIATGTTEPNRSSFNVASRLHVLVLGHRLTARLSQGAPIIGLAFSESKLQRGDCLFPAHRRCEFGRLHRRTPPTLGWDDAPRY